MADDVVSGHGGADQDQNHAEAGNNQCILEGDPKIHLLHNLGEMPEVKGCRQSEGAF